MFSLCPCMAEARASSFFFLSIASSLSVSLAVLARLPEISVYFHYAPFRELFSTGTYVAMVCVSRVGSYKPRESMRTQWSLQKTAA